MALPIQIVDENDVPLRPGTKEEAWTEGLFHRVVRIMIEDRTGKILLQKRAYTRKLFPDCWDNSAAGHVDANEDYERAAYRELNEELGIRNVKLEEIGKYSSNEVHSDKKLNRFSKVYKAMVEPIDIPKFESSEVAELKWVTKAEMLELVQNHPEKVTDGLRQVAKMFYRSN